MSDMEKNGIVPSPKRRHLTLEEYYWREAVEITENSNIYYPRCIERIDLRSNSTERLPIVSLNLGIYPRLKEIHIHSQSIQNCGEVIIHGMEKLEIVDFGQYNFNYRDDENTRGLLRISSCPNLVKIVIGDGSFRTFKELVIMDLNSITDLIFGTESFNTGNSLIKGGINIKNIEYTNM